MKKLSLLLVTLLCATVTFTVASTTATAAVSEVVFSTSSDRSNPQPLHGKTVAGNIYSFISPATGITKVKFYVDSPQLGGTPYKIEKSAPWDLGGGPDTGLAFPFDTTTLADGTHSITAQVILSTGTTEVVNAEFVVNNTGAPPPPPPPPPPSAWDLRVSLQPDRSGSTPVEGAVLGGNMYAFVTPDGGLNRVSFFVDDPQMNGTPAKIEKGAPFDLAETNTSNGNANPFDTTTLTDGVHSLTVELKKSAGGFDVITGNFTVNNGTPSLTVGPSPVAFDLEPGATSTATVNVGTTDGSTPGFAVVDDAPWLTAAPASGTVPGAVTLTANATGLAEGAYAASVTVSSNGYRDAVAAVHLTVGDPASCGPVACEDLLVELPYELDFSSDHGFLEDSTGIGTGFTYLDPTSAGTGFMPDKLDVDNAAGELRLTTTSGLAYTTSNSQDNALGVGIDVPSHNVKLATDIVAPPAGTGDSQQVGLWFGLDEDNYDKITVQSTDNGTKIEHLSEVDGAKLSQAKSGVVNVASSRVRLELHAVPSNRTVLAKYGIDGGPLQNLGTFTLPSEFFSFDAAGIDPRIGTRTFGGIFASHRNGPAPQVYRFDSFSVTQADSTPPPPPGGTTFTRTSYGGVNMPTSMAWGPDNRLYVSEAFGELHALTFNQNKEVTADQVITSLGSRLTLGLTIDPASTPSNVILWVSHSNPSFDQGLPNSGVISRLSGPTFSQRTDVITGLPRAIANHSINSIHFGPDNRLYIAQGGNTGAGAPNTANTEFGDMQEQPLSAAILVADVKSAGFDGSCHNPNIFGPPPCHVVTHATGLRNAYDFVFHSNGEMYATENGLGVTGSYPPSPNPPCFGFGSTQSYKNGGNNPGDQPDNFLRIVAGKYYGHPNPYRNECVFKDGSFQGVPPLPNFEPPTFNLGKNKSANGMIEYNSNQLCGTLKGEMLIANYSQGDDITRLRLSPDGRTVLSASSLVGGFNDPLPITQGPDGTIYVGEFGGDEITALVPDSVGCWTSAASLPAKVLDAGGTALDGKLYVVGGKTATATQSSVYVFNPATGAWSQGPNLPGAAVENPAVVSGSGKLYAFGGSTAPFSGAQNSAAVFDPIAGSWSSLPPMPTARAGASAQVVGGNIYVVGGMGNNGASLNTVEIFNPTSGTWSTGPSLGTRRDNPGSAVLDGRLYVFGGRTREADGSTPQPTLASVEMFDLASGVWTARAPMPTGRRTMVVGLLNGRAQVIGGEITAGGGSFATNEQYDPVSNTWQSLAPLPTPRHGAVAGTIGTKIYVVGGGPSGGTSFTDVLEVFGF